jgi:hypothetical protein
LNAVSKPNPFVILDLNQSASSEEIRRAWRLQARKLHPDSGGTHARMVELNWALAEALASTKSNEQRVPSFIHRDVSVFTISAPIGTAWKSLELVAAESGSVIHAEPLESIEFTLHDSSIDGALQAWCRCSLVPEAGGVTVNVEVGSAASSSVGLLDSVREHLVDALNALDWS